jgi:hypothetical protein
MQGVRAQWRQECLTLIASLTSAATRQLSARTPGRCLYTPGLQMADNFYRVWCFALP